MFDRYIKDGSVRKGTIDKELAKSLVKIAQFRWEKAKREDPAEENSFFIVENAYEAVKEVVDALMALEGFKSYSHEANIDFLKEFYPKEVHLSMIFTIDRYRKLRNDIKYRGVIPSMQEGKAAIDDLEKIFVKIQALVKRKIS